MAIRNKSISSLFSRFIRFSNSEDTDIFSVQRYWIARKYRLITITGFLMAFLLVVGIEAMNAINPVFQYIDREIFSRSQLISKISNSEIFLDLRNAILVEELPLSIIFSILICFWVIWTILTDSNIFDDNQNFFNARNELKSSNAKGPFWFASREISKFALVHPANTIVRTCNSCANTDCRNRVSNLSFTAFDRWSRMMQELKPENLNQLLKSTHAIRRNILTRFVLLYTAVIIIGAFILFQMLLVFLGDRNGALDLVGLIYGVFLLALYALFSILNRSQNSGVNTHISDIELISSAFSDRAEYLKIHELVVCSFNGLPYKFTKTENTPDPINVYAGRNLELLSLKQSFLDMDLVYNYVSTLKNTENSKQVNPLKPVLNTMTAVYEMLSSIHSNVNFRTALFIPNHSGGFLESVLKVTANQEKNDNQAIDVNLSRAMFSLERGSPTVVAQSWHSNQILSASATEINYFTESQNEYLRSVIAFPLTLPVEVAEEMTASNFPYESKLGVLAIDCDSADIFTAKTLAVNSILIESFVLRMSLEIATLYIQKVKISEEAAEWKGSSSFS